jgi:cellulose synthase/poly-beta-1,6-N-acetylglucosamine synthase-like glycosyltransferase
MHAAFITIKGSSPHLATPSRVPELTTSRVARLPQKGKRKKKKGHTKHLNWCLHKRSVFMKLQSATLYWPLEPLCGFWLQSFPFLSSSLHYFLLCYFTSVFILISILSLALHSFCFLVLFHFFPLLLFLHSVLYFLLFFFLVLFSLLIFLPVSIFFVFLPFSLSSVSHFTNFSFFLSASLLFVFKTEHTITITELQYSHGNNSHGWWRWRRSRFLPLCTVFYSPLRISPTPTMSHGLRQRRLPLVESV